MDDPSILRELVTRRIAQLIGARTADLRVQLRPPLDYQSNRLYDVWTAGRHLIAKEFLKPDEFAARRHELTRARAIQALRELDRAGTAVTFAAVAAAAGISRSWLYTQPDIRDQIQQLRTRTSRTPGTPVPASQRPTDASHRARLTAALQRNQALAD